jgi:hypothetical protein
MHRWFRIDAARKDLAYEPIIHYREGWADAIAWFKVNWLPKFHEDQKNGKCSRHSRRLPPRTMNLLLLIDHNHQ